MNLTDLMTNMNNRVGALESNNLDDNAGIARIVKLYGDVKVTMTISVSTHQYPICSNSLICSASLII